MGPCDNQHARVIFDECRATHCQTCNSCTQPGRFTCCYYTERMCTDDAHLGQSMYDEHCEEMCYATHNPYGGGGGDCPIGMLCE